jgi:PDZ domain-containing protein
MEQTVRRIHKRLVRKHPSGATLGLTWLVVIPAGVWGIAYYYLPALAANLSPASTWLVTLAILALTLFSLSAHILAHWWVGRALGNKVPARLAVMVFGDAAQRWSKTLSASGEGLAAAAGPLVNLLLAAVAYLVWVKTAGNILNLVVLFVCGLNAWLFIINLIPVYPLDGGRLMGLVLRGILPKPDLEGRVLRVGGFGLAVALTGWGVFLIAQHSRFSLETGLITFLMVLLLLDGLRFRPGSDLEQSAPLVQGKRRRLLRWVGATLLSLLLLAGSGSLLLVNNGLQAPGVALPVAPMIQLPAQYRHTHSGQFYLLTVIEQAPITAGEWVLGKVDPAMQIVPPESVTPRNTTPQQQARQDFQMLDTSETTAIAVGLSLAGYPTPLVGKGVQVDSILPESHANGILQVGDVITAVNGEPVQTANDLINLVSGLKSEAPVQMQVSRGQESLNVDVPLLPPSSPAAGPKIGIEIQTAGFDYNPPFPVSIETSKISGGPSAGLMFTLTVYNSLISEDLTGGHRIAGTGTINLDGSVGPIGGVKQKVFAAEAVGAEVFLCPVDNYEDAVSVAKNIQVIKVATVDQALEFLRSLPPAAAP